MDQLPTQRQCTLQLAGMLQLTHMWDTASQRPQLTDMLAGVYACEGSSKKLLFNLSVRDLQHGACGAPEKHSMRTMHLEHHRTLCMILIS